MDAPSAYKLIFKVLQQACAFNSQICLDLKAKDLGLDHPSPLEPALGSLPKLSARSGGAVLQERFGGSTLALELQGF